MTIVKATLCVFALFFLAVTTTIIHPTTLIHEHALALPSTVDLTADSANNLLSQIWYDYPQYVKTFQFTLPSTFNTTALATLVPESYINCPQCNLKFGIDLLTPINVTSAGGPNGSSWTLSLSKGTLNVSTVPSVEHPSNVSERVREDRRQHRGDNPMVPNAPDSVSVLVRGLSVSLAKVSIESNKLKLTVNFGRLFRSRVLESTLTKDSNKLLTFVVSTEFTDLLLGTLNNYLEKGISLPSYLTDMSVELTQQMLTLDFDVAA